MAGRKKNTWHGARDARAAFELQEQFEELFKAATGLRDQGSYDRLEVALDQLQYDSEYRGFPALADAMPRDQRIAALAGRYSSISHMITRLATIADQTEALRRRVGDELRDAILTPSDDVPEYARQFLKGLQAENIEQCDLRSAPRALAKVAAKAIREYNEQRRRSPDAAHEYYLDHPVGEWTSLPRAFAGVELIDIGPDEKQLLEPLPLPATTDIADYTADRNRPPTRENRRETIRAWAKIIERWADANDVSMTGMQPAVWALLLGHRMKVDTSDIRNLNGSQIQSPWHPKRIVRIEVLNDLEDSPEIEDDVPY